MKRELSKLQDDNHQLESELLRLRETSGNNDAQHAVEMAKIKTDFEEEMSALKQQQESQLVEVKLRVEAIKTENEGLKAELANEKGEAKKRETEVNEKSGKEVDALQVELQKMKEDNKKLKAELDNAQKYVIGCVQQAIYKISIKILFGIVIHDPYSSYERQPELMKLYY